MVDDAVLLFTPEELSELVKHPGDKAFDALDRGEYDSAKEVCRQYENCHKESTHDIYVAWNAQTLSYVYREFGLSIFREFLRESIAPWFRPIAELFRNGISKEAVSYLAQLCRVDCGEFGLVTEDADKITFVMDPCGSGGRLVQEGHYSDSVQQPLSVLEDADVLTEGRRDFPIYCTSCKMAEILMIEWLGYPAFVLDCHPEKGIPSLLTIYKDPDKIPMEYFSRVGQDRNASRISGAVSVAGGLLFTPQERKDLMLQYSKRAIAAMDNGDMDLAKGYCRSSKNEWHPLHHIYRDWITGQLSFVYRNYGVEKVYDAVCKCYLKLIEDNLLVAGKALDIKKQVELLSLAFTQHAMHFRIEEDVDKFAFIAQPCGSGGRLIDEKAYEFPKNFARIKEAHKVGCFLNDFPIYCVHCPVTNELIFRKGGPYLLIVDGDRMKTWENGCIFYIFKNPNAIPERLYEQVGMKKP